MRELLVIDNVAVEGSLLTRKFACDLLKCKGACCSLPGGRGAPLLDSELDEIQETIPAVLPMLSEEKRKAIEQSGFYEGEPGDYATTCIDDEDCVFVYREKGVAKCAIERAYNEGKVSFRKPISCHLYPIRVNKFGGDVLRYHEIPECKPAIIRGESENMSVVEFLKTPLIRKYGEEWFDGLLRRIPDGEVNASPVPVMSEKTRKKG
jgi:Protein of unknown function (DUF3109)